VCVQLCVIQEPQNEVIYVPFGLSATGKISVKKVAHFSKLFYHTVFYGDTVSHTSVAPTSQVCMSGMLLLLIVGNRIMHRWVDFHWHNICVTFQ
jgi:hypothetical protein